jgi:prepilin-type N-terminal cleavage/methylation domain-containing protein
MLADWRSKHKPVRYGFTLIEISIVLIIIGLISAGVLVGRDLIRASEIRATISQKLRYDTAVNAFRDKYNGLPGDLTAEQADAFGFFFFDDSPQTGFGDGNGLLENGQWAGTGMFPLAQTGEVMLFWRHLSEAQLIDGLYGQTIDPVTGDSATAPDLNVGRHLPRSKLSTVSYFSVTKQDGLNYYRLTKTTMIGVGGATSYGAALTPQDAYMIDVKIDNGKPNTGAVTNLGGPGCGGLNPTDCWQAVPIAGQACLTGGTYEEDPLAIYATTPNEVATAFTCVLQLRFN